MLFSPFTGPCPKIPLILKVQSHTRCPLSHPTSIFCYLPSNFPFNLELQVVVSFGLDFAAFSAISSARLKQQKEIS